MRIDPAPYTHSLINKLTIICAVIMAASMLDACASAFFDSLTKRLFGFDAWRITLISIPLTVMGFVFAYRRTAAEDSKLQSMGIGPIYKLAKHKHHWEIIFGLGYHHGIQPGEHLLILDAKKREVGQLVVLEVGAEHSLAYLGRQLTIGPDYYIAKRDEMEKASN